MWIGKTFYCYLHKSSRLLRTENWWWVHREDTIWTRKRDCHVSWCGCYPFISGCGISLKCHEIYVDTSWSLLTIYMLPFVLPLENPFRTPLFHYDEYWKKYLSRQLNIYSTPKLAQQHWIVVVCNCSRLAVMALWWLRTQEVASRPTYRYCEWWRHGRFALFLIDSM